MAPPEDSGEGDQNPAPSGGAGQPEENKPADDKPSDEGKTFTQAEVDRIIAGRFQKFADYDDIKKELGTLRDATATEQEKAVKAAREEARQEALTEIAPRLVRAEFKAAAKGRMEPSALDSLLEDLDLTKFLTDKGEVDVERIEKKVTALAPEPGANKPPLRGGPRKTEKPETKPGLDRLRSAYADSATP
jgi:hypothetical protein